MRAFCFGFSYWKRGHIKRFLSLLNKRAIFCSSLNEALKKGLNSSDEIYIWGMRCDDVQSWAKENNIKINRIEDGFIRSVTLGSDLTKAYSLVIDKRGIYFNPQTPSDLEYLINNYNFDEAILNRAKNLQKLLIKKRVSKYNVLKEKRLNLKTSKKKILVIGQVEDDASIIYGGFGMNNLKLLQKVREKNKNEFLIYKPHPDVVAGNRKGHIPEDIVLKYADLVVDDISIVSLFDEVDEVHTISSLSGMEALMRGKKVFTYGMPFYAGWGLTIDEIKCKRRKKTTLEKLIAAAYILYPYYISPKTNRLCEVEEYINEIEELKNRYKNNRIYKFFVDLKSFISRKSQLVLRKIIEVR